MISFDAALALIEESATLLGTEAVPLNDAAGRVLAADLLASIDSPRCDVSSMDGYAVRSDDLAQLPARLRVVSRSFPDGKSEEPVSQGTCVRIFTGAPVPRGANLIVIQENVARDGEFAIVKKTDEQTRYIRRRASDFAAGDALLRQGRRLDPRALITAAGGDVGTVEVITKPRLKILSTGDELVVAGTAQHKPGTIPDSISGGVAALAEQWGASCVGRMVLPDDLKVLQSAALGAGENTDLIVVTGGASVGEKDFSKEMFAPLGLQMIFSKVSMRPGKPVWLGEARGQLVLGLPGNPTSAFVTARLLLVPLLMIMQGRKIADALTWQTVRLASPLLACDGRETFHRGTLLNGVAERLPSEDLGAQKVLSDATILMRQSACSKALAAGDEIQILAL